MSIREQIPYLEQLSAVDVEIKRIDEQLERHKSGLSGMRTEVKALEDRLKTDRETHAAMEKTRGELVTEVRQMTQQIERSRDKLNRSRNERESNAAQREIEELRKLLRDREDDVERLNLATEAARVAIDDAEGKRLATAFGVDEGLVISSRCGNLQALKPKEAKPAHGTFKAYEPGYLHAESQTALMRFTDDLEFLLAVTEGVIHLRSASRIGYGDRGVNRARIEDIRRAFDTSVEPKAGARPRPATP